MLMTTVPSSPPPLAGDLVSGPSVPARLRIVAWMLFVVAERLVLQPASVRRNVSRILAKLHLRDRVQIAVAWYKSGG